MYMYNGSTWSSKSRSRSHLSLILDPNMLNTVLDSLSFGQVSNALRHRQEVENRAFMYLYRNG
jgi:hypothetical protein